MNVICEVHHHAVQISFDNVKTFLQELEAFENNLITLKSPYPRTCGPVPPPQSTSRSSLTPPLPLPTVSSSHSHTPRLKSSKMNMNMYIPHSTSPQPSKPNSGASSQLPKQGRTASQTLLRKAPPLVHSPRIPRICPLARPPHWNTAASRR